MTFGDTRHPAHSPSKDLNHLPGDTQQRQMPSALAKCLAIPACHGGREEYEPLFRNCIRRDVRRAVNYQSAGASNSANTTARGKIYQPTDRSNDPFVDQYGS